MYNYVMCNNYENFKKSQLWGLSGKKFLVQVKGFLADVYILCHSAMDLYLQ